MSNIDRQLFESGMIRFYDRVHEAHGEVVTDYERMLKALVRSYTESAITFSHMRRPYSEYESTGTLLSSFGNILDISTPYDNTVVGGRYFSTIRLGWVPDQLHNSGISVWGRSIVNGTHRSFFGQANAGISKGSPVMTPYYLNESSYLPHIGMNYYKGFIDNAINSYDKWAVASYKKIFMENFKQ